MSFEKQACIDTATENYICLFLSNTEKEVKAKKEPNLLQIVSKFPYANVYTIYKNTGNKFKLGSYFECTEANKQKFLVFFTQKYPGHSKFPNDTPKVRKQLFREVLTQLQKRKLDSLAFDYGNMVLDNGADYDEYKQIIDDFTATYQLNNKTKLTTIIYRDSEAVIPAAVNRTNNNEWINDNKPNKKKANIVKLSKKPNKPNKAPVDKLDINQVVLRESILTIDDFCRYTIVDEFDAKLNLMELALDTVTQDWHWLFSDTVVKARLEQTEKTISLPEFYADDTFPNPSQIFNAFNHCSFSDLKVVILGQDPYPTRGNAHGLCFSVADGVATPASLKNIYKAMETDDNLDPPFTAPTHGNLTNWANNGVLMLNSGLTVKEGKAGSHLSQWETTTDRMIQAISDKAKDIVFVLWGGKAKKKAKLINKARNHLILEFSHPSPLSANRYGFDCKHFSQINIFLQKQGKKPIDWTL